MPGHAETYAAHPFCSGQEVRLSFPGCSLHRQEALLQDRRRQALSHGSG